MAVNDIFNKNLVICRGCDHISTIIMQNRYRFKLHGEDHFIYKLLNLEHSIVRLSIYTEWATSQTNTRNLLNVFNSIPGKFAEQTSDGNIIGLGGRFSAILQEDSLEESTEYYLGIHIPNNITGSFDFTEAHYEVNLLGLAFESMIEKTSILLAQGKIDIIEGFYDKPVTK